MEKLKNFFIFTRDSPTAPDDGGDEQQLGFKIFHYPDLKSIGVKVIAARNLPPTFGNVKPKGYLVKVKLFPGKDKYETKVLPSTCPCFDEQYTFTAGIANLSEISGKFITLTVYGELEGTSGGSKGKLSDRPRNSMREHIEAFVQSNGIEMRTNSTQRANRFSLNNRRTIGVVTFKLDKQIFTETGKGSIRYTPDIWRTITDINSGREVQPKESKKGSLEVSMRYSNSEDGRNDMLHISLTKFRCSMATMQEHERLGGNLYLKMATHEYDVVVSKWKGDTFAPTISMKIEPQSATMITTINNYNLDKTKVIIKLKCRNVLQQKHELGMITIDWNTELFKEIVNNPTVDIQKMLEFQ